MALGPFLGHYLIVDRVSIDFNTSQAYPSRFMTWVRLFGLSITCYKKSMLKATGSHIGSINKFDFHSDNGCIQLVEYDSFLIVCYGCGTCGHTQDLYLKLSTPLTTT
ncbi:hypothetical protein V6N11_075633 [Hibiscus sabdariffa]|uniref:Uncharacterized protein n=2 Tax=Hibiscus sabdariffa TaxID=183260 RepID=A0ABR1ZME6_9ROSI